MREIILIRHGLTRWNLEKRIQGQTDVPLCDDGIIQVKCWRLAARYLAGEWHVSPLARTHHTARLLGADRPTVSPALIEMDWGEWTGRRLADLRCELGTLMRENERLGLDFRPPGGESPRNVRARFAAWLDQLADRPEPLCAVTHKGVIRAAISLATGWNLESDYGEKLSGNGFHRFFVDAGVFRLERLNVPLLPDEPIAS